VELPAPGNNGPSGKWLLDQVLRPLVHQRRDCCVTDCLDTARLNPGQQQRIKLTYEPQGERLSPAARSTR
jgi:hypothetical protein